MYQYKDHLGNIRLSYDLDEANSVVVNEDYSETNYDWQAIHTASYTLANEELNFSAVNRWHSINKYIDVVPNKTVHIEFDFKKGDMQVPILFIKEKINGVWESNADRDRYILENGHFEVDLNLQGEQLRIYFEKGTGSTDNGTLTTCYIDNLIITQNSLEIVEEHNYYPFGLKHNGYNNLQLANHPYKYNGKELNEELELDWYDYGARNYDATLGRWLSIDPLSDNYRSLSIYNYVSNSPISMFDPDGERISFSFEYEKDTEGNIVRDKDGNTNLVGITMTLTGKVMNISGKEVNMDDAIGEISESISSSFSGNVDGVEFRTEVDLKVAKSMKDVDESDHVFALAVFPEEKSKRQFGEDQYGNSKADASGVTNEPGGMVAFLDVDYFIGGYDTTIGGTGERTAAHEFASHMLNLGHTNRFWHLTYGGGVRFSHVTKNQLKATISRSNDDCEVINRGTNYDVRMFNLTGRKVLDKGEGAKLIKWK